jgi:hypothetical protein
MAALSSEFRKEITFGIDCSSLISIEEIESALDFDNDFFGMTELGPWAGVE